MFFIVGTGNNQLAAAAKMEELSFSQSKIEIF